MKTNDMVLSTSAVNRIDHFFNGKSNTANRTRQRAFIKQLLNRKSIYRLSDYVRKTRKALGINITTVDVRCSLRRMENEGQIAFEIKDGKVYGWSC